MYLRFTRVYIEHVYQHIFYSIAIDLVPYFYKESNFNFKIRNIQT